MNYDDYKQNIVNQLKTKTGLDLVWEDFVLSDQQSVSGKTIQVTITPTVQGTAKMKGTSTFIIDRMDLTNQTYVFDWTSNGKRFGADVFMHDKQPNTQEELLDILGAAIGIELSIDDFEPVLFKPDLRLDVTIDLTAKESSLYYYGTLRVTLTHPWVNQVTMDINPAKDVIVTAALVGSGTVTVDGTIVSLPYTIPAGNHQVSVRAFSIVGGGFAFLTPIRLRLLRVYSGKYNGLFKNATALTTVDELSIQAAGGTSTTIMNLFDGCIALKDLPAVLFMPDSSVSDMAYLFANSGITSVPSTLFTNMEYVGRTLDYLFQSTASLTTVPGDLFDPIAASVTNTSGLFQQAGITSLPSNLFSKFSALVTINNFCYGASKLQAIPVGLFGPLPALTTLNAAFRLCVALTAIPAKLFDNNTQMTQCNYVFANCVNITAIPKDLLIKNVKLVQVNYLFSNTAITAIPTGLFDTLPELVHASSLFNGCGKLTAIDGQLFAKNPKLSVCESLFDGCSSLTAIPTTLFAYTQNLTNVSLCFRNVPLSFTIPSDFFPGVKITNIAGVFRNSGLVSIEPGLFKAHTRLVTTSYAFSGTKLKTIPKNTLVATENTVQQALEVFSNCAELESIEAGAVVLTSTLTQNTYGNYASFFANCGKLSSIAQAGVRIEGRVASLVSMFNGCSSWRGTVAEFLKRVSFDISTPVESQLDCSNMFNGVIWLEGTCMDMWNGVTNSAVLSAKRVRNDFIEQCFLLTDYEDVGSPWWTTPISLDRAKGKTLDVFTLGTVTPPPGHKTIPLYSTYYVDIPRDVLSNSFGALDNAPITGSVRMWLARVFMTLGLDLPTDITTISLFFSLRGQVGHPTNAVRPEVKLAGRLVFNRSATYSDWTGTDTYLLCSLTG